MTSWDRQSDEPDNSWRAFQAYLEMSIGHRDILKAYRIAFDKGPRGRPPAWVEKEAENWNWAGRALERDMEYADEDTDTRSQLIAHEKKIALQLMLRAEEMLAVPLFDDEELFQPDGTKVIYRRVRENWKPVDAVAYARAGSEVWRLAEGMVTERKMLLTGADFYAELIAALTPEEFKPLIPVFRRLLEAGR